MNRTLLLLIVVAVLGAGFWYLQQEKAEGPATSVVGADRDFAVDQNLVHKVFLADRRGNTTTLERTSDGWIYNEKYPARPDAINNLLNAIHSIQMSYMPAKGASSHMVKSLATNGIKVEVYGKEDELLKAYYVGGATSDERGTYIIMEGSEQPYVGELKHWVGNLRFRYNLKGDDWRDRTLFNVAAENIASVSIDYPKQQNKSFRMNLKDGEVELKPFYPLTPEIQTPIRNERVDVFTHSFEKIISAGYNNYNKEREAILKTVPFAIINLEQKNGETNKLTLYAKYGEPMVDPKTGIVTEAAQVESYYGYTGNEDFMMVQDQIIEKILWGYEFFF